MLLDGSVAPMPLTQRHIAEATGLTSIHVNRVLRQLREDLVIDLRDGNLSILNAKKFRAVVETGDGWMATLAAERREVWRTNAG